MSFLMQERPLYVASGRTTHVDVMCATNTAVRYEKKENAKGGRFRCKLPYEEKQVSAYKTHTSFSQTLSERQCRQRLNQAMIAERDRFMKKLRKEREIRVDAELQAAIVIQAVSRGTVLRLRLHRTEGKHRRASKRPYNDIDNLKLELMSLAQTAGLIPLAGDSSLGEPPVIISPKKKRILAKKRLQEKERAAIAIQATQRIIIAKGTTASLRQKQSQFSNKQQASETLQRIYRGHFTRKDLSETKHQAATSIQSHFRRNTASILIHNLKQEQFNEQRKHQAASKIQATGRGHSVRKLASSARLLFDDTSQLSKSYDAQNEVHDETTEANKISL